MKRRRATGEQDELRPEYDLRELLRHAVRGKHAGRYRQGTNLVLLDPAIARAFPTDASVNDALRLVLRLSEIPEPAHPEAVKR
ncbi:MAG: hypothetical protein FJ291_14710 [Planctomycetes bacterium]|nr:hypothetical protein [Planctomycetota bacterium]